MHRRKIPLERQYPWLVQYSLQDGGGQGLELLEGWSLLNKPTRHVPVREIVLDQRGQALFFKYNKHNRSIIMQAEILEFQTIDRNFSYDEVWGWWSRVYEYPLILNKIHEIHGKKELKVHNTSWGFGPQHHMFKWRLERCFDSVTSSDIKVSSEPNTIHYDITTIPSRELIACFDVVLNVSTIEEIEPGKQRVSFENLMSMVKPGGILVATFDIPGINLDEFEEMFNRKLIYTSSPISGINSVYPDERYRDLRVGYFVVRRLK